MKSKGLLLSLSFTVLIVVCVWASILHIEKVQAQPIQATKWDFYADSIGRCSFSIPSHWQYTIGYCQVFADKQVVAKVATLISPNGLVLTYIADLPKEYINHVYTTNLDEEFYYNNNYDNVWTVQTDLDTKGIGSIGIYSKSDGSFKPGIVNIDGSACAFYSNINSTTTYEDIADARCILASFNRW